MPVTTTPEIASYYQNDLYHFKHVMDFLFKPAIEKAGFKVILPLAQGSDIIQDYVISNLESADLVLCDMSTHNANVFFELGIRTALNKPVCLVKDDITEKVPFDAAFINNYTYSSDLSIWIVKQEIENLARHINESLCENNSFNSLWKYLGFKTSGSPPEKINGESVNLEYITFQIEAIRKQLNELSNTNLLSQGRSISNQQPKYKLEELMASDIMYLLNKYGLNEKNFSIRHNMEKKKLDLLCYENIETEEIPSEFIKSLRALEKIRGYEVNLPEKLKKADF